ncbi:MAG: CinA family protein [Oscillospiraceae bacterium]|nr:CinA family protein [Oscillospiraceae bacterium]
MTDKNYSFAQDVVDLLKERKLKISFAESCTGGMAAAAITEINGASGIIDMSVVTYANWAKIEYTDVTDEVLTAYGAVSEQTASLMAAGIRKRAGADIGVGITGIAGPSGGTLEKPVGTVYIAIDLSGKVFKVERFAFSGKRDEVRLKAVQNALIMLLKLLED